MAEAKLTAAESLSLVKADNMRGSKDIHVKAINKMEERNFEGDSTLVGTVDDGFSVDDDEASKYQPAQGEDKKSLAVKRSPRPSRSSSRIRKGKKYWRR
jgi:hypothetical protein